MGKTRGQIKADIQSNLSDLSLNYYSNDDYNNVIQDAYDDIAVLTQCIQNNITINWISNLSYYNFRAIGISDYLGAIGVFNNVTNLWLRDDLNIKDFDRIRRDWETWIGAPIFWAPSDPSNIAIAAKYQSSVANTWQSSTTVPDGVTTDFYFSSIPIECSYNGVNQFPGVGYFYITDVTGIHVRFIDALGNILTPQVGDDIRGFLAPNDLGSFKLYYWGVAPTLATDNDTFLIASDQNQLLTQYSTASLLEDAQEFNKAKLFWNQYYVNIEAYADRVKRLTKSDLLLRL